MYGLSKMLTKLFGAITKPSLGTIQPALKRLEKQGYIKSDKFFTEGGKPYYYYTVTPNGKSFLKSQILAKPSDNPAQLYPAIKIKLMCSDILNAEDKKLLCDTLETESDKIKSIAETTLNSEMFSDNYSAKMVINNTVCEYNNLITLIKDLKHACDS